MAEYITTGGYNPSSIMNPQLQLNNYMAEGLRQRANSGYQQALGNPPSAVNIASGAVAGFLLGKAIADIFGL